MPSGNKQGSVAYKEYMKKVNAALADPNNKAVINTLVGNVATGNTLFSNIDYSYLRGEKYNSGYAAELNYLTRRMKINGDSFFYIPKQRRR